LVPAYLSCPGKRPGVVVVVVVVVVVIIIIIAMTMFIKVIARVHPVHLMNVD